MLKRLPPLKDLTNLDRFVKKVDLNLGGEGDAPMASHGYCQTAPLSPGFASPVPTPQKSSEPQYGFVTVRAYYLRLSSTSKLKSITSKTLALLSALEVLLSDLWALFLEEYFERVILHV